MIYKSYKYEIKSSPDPLNPNEQSCGTTINDDRLYGMKNLVVTYQTQSYNEDEFNKPLLSNVLELTIGGQTFSLGQTVIITGIQTLE